MEGENVMAAEFLSTFAIICVFVATVGVGSLAVFVARLLASRISATDRLVVMWLIYNALIHFILVSSSQLTCIYTCTMSAIMNK